jgi:general secretion pathway protein G
MRFSRVQGSGFRVQERERIPRRRSAFSLVEVMIVVVIIGLMATMVTFATTRYLDKAKRQRARADIVTLSGAVDSFYLHNGKFPTNQEGLKVLAPEFIKNLPGDPWGHPYQYVQPGRSGPYDIISFGADGREGGTGGDADISSADIDMNAARGKTP